MTSTLYAGLVNRRALIDRKREVQSLSQALVDKGSASDKRQAVVGVLKEALKGGRCELKARLVKTRGEALQNSPLSVAASTMLAPAGFGPNYARGHAFLIDQVLRLLFDALTQAIYPNVNPTMAERITLVAVGGYGRGELAPFSDIDLLFLTPYKQTSWGEQIIEAMLYALWDMGLKVGHASRSIDDLLRMAGSDLSVRTAFLEARYLWGDDALYDKALAAFRTQLVQGTTSQFVAEKLQERDARHKRMGDSRYVVEPNLKEGKGGLRDLHTLLWIARYVEPVQHVQDLVGVGLFTPEELRLFLRAYRFLWTVRCQLHLLTNRAEERLTFDVQPELARLLGYADRPGLRGVERFMKHYFLIAKQVGALTAQFLAHLEETHRKKPLFRLPQITRRPSRLNGFTLSGGKLSIPEPDFFKKDPVRLLEMFHLAEVHRLDIHPIAMRQAGRDSDLIKAPLRNDARANALFLDILTSPHTPEERLRSMNEAGIFGRFIPDFGRVVAQMQYDMYHHYTVDEHTIRAIGLLAAIEKGALQADHPIATQLVPHLASRRVLYVAVLLHDIAKGRGGDHSVIGEEIALALCPRLGLSLAETQTVAWLVRWHLLMSATAFKRDLSDFKTILDFAEQVQSPERLRLLLVLTVVDIRAVGPGVWNSWKGQLLRDLYQATQEVLIAGHKQSGRRERIASQQQALLQALAWPADPFDWYTRRFFDSYWIAEPVNTLILNAQMIRKADKDKRTLALAHGEERARGATLLSVYTDDHPGLFSRLSGALALAGANILDAKVHTLRDGRALDNFIIQDQTGAPIVDPARLDRLYKTIEDALLGRIRLSDRLAAKPLLRARAHAFQFAPVVIIDNNLSNRFSVIEVNALDRPALLFSLTSALYHSKITIHSAHIATYGERAVDTFYVTDLTGDKISNTNRLRALERRLTAAALLEAQG